MTYEQIEQALQQTGVPVALHTYKGDAETFIVYHQFDENGAFFSDNEEQATNFYYEISVVSKTDYRPFVDIVKQKLKELGGRRTYETDVHEGDYYQRTLRFTFSKLQGE